MHINMRVLFSSFASQKNILTKRDFYFLQVVFPKYKHRQIGGLSMVHTLYLHASGSWDKPGDPGVCQLEPTNGINESQSGIKGPACLALYRADLQRMLNTPSANNNPDIQ